MPDAPQAHDSIMGNPWKAHVEAQRQSGLSRAEYCRRHNLSYHALTYWVKKTTQAVPSTPDRSSFVPVPITLPVSPKKTERPDSGLRLRLANDITIEVYTGFSTTTLSALLSTLGVHP